MTRNRVFIAVTLLPLLYLLCLYLGSFAILLPRFVYIFSICLGLLFFLLCLLYFYLVCSYIWVFHLLYYVCFAFAQFIPVSESSIFSAMSTIDSCTFSIELLICFALVFLLASKYVEYNIIGYFFYIITTFYAYIYIYISLYLQLETLCILRIISNYK